MPNKEYLAATCGLNEGQKIQRVLQKFSDYSLYDVLVIDDGSTDGSLDRIPEGPITKIVHKENKGAGYCVREMLEYARKNGYKAIFLISGNDKDDPKDIYKLHAAIEKGFDFAQGSRYLPDGKIGQMPAYRFLATKFVHPLLFSIFSGRRITDSTNGFRAIRLSFLDDKRIDMNQTWLDRYELEPYLFFKAITLGYKVTEVPVTKIYPSKAIGYTKMKPITGWWSILRPLFLLGFRIRK